MQVQSDPSGRRRWTLAIWITLCAALAAACVIIVYVASTLWELREPFVDLSSGRQQVATTRGASDGSRRLRFAVATMVTAEATSETYGLLVQRVARDVGSKGAFVLRPSYAAVRRELEAGNVDVAFVCTGTYVHALKGGRIRLLVQPEFKPGLQYQSLIIVPARGGAENLEDLGDGVMAFTDSESNTGCLVPSLLLAEKGLSPEIVFTGSHDRSILAVSLGVVGSAAVDSLVWDSKKEQDPSLAQRVRVIWTSEPFGPPPIVVPVGLAEDLKDALRASFLGLDQDQEGLEILSAIGIKRFVPARVEDYRSAVRLYKRLHPQEEDR